MLELIQNRFPLQQQSYQKNSSAKQNSACNTQLKLPLRVILREFSFAITRQWDNEKNQQSFWHSSQCTYYSSRWQPLCLFSPQVVNNTYRANGWKTVDFCCKENINKSSPSSLHTYYLFICISILFQGLYFTKWLTQPWQKWNFSYF